MEYKIYINENDNIVPYTLIYKDNIQLKSTHPPPLGIKQRIYEMWTNCYIKETNKPFHNLFIIKQHNPWIDNKIIDSDEIKNNIYKYTQNKNNITEVYNINKELIITRLYDINKDQLYFPCLIKSLSISAALRNSSESIFSASILSFVSNSNTFFCMSYIISSRFC